MKRMPAGEALDRSMLTNGLGNLDSRGLAALLKELAKERHAKRAREVSIQVACWWMGSARQQQLPSNRSSRLLLLLLLVSIAVSLNSLGEQRLEAPSACNHSRVTTAAAVALASAAVG